MQPCHRTNEINLDHLAVVFEIEFFDPTGRIVHACNKDHQVQTAEFSHDGPPGAITAQAGIANFSFAPPYIQPIAFTAARERR